jgi:hypothetical protein
MTAHFDGRYSVAPRFSDLLAHYRFSKLKFIAACGFEERASSILRQLAGQIDANADIQCIILDLLNRKDPSYLRARRQQRRNIAEMTKLVQHKKWDLKTIKVDLYSKELIARKPLLDALTSILRKFSGDFFLDISCIPRSILFPAMKMLWESDRARNLFVGYTEDPKAGALEKQADKYRPPAFISGFSLNESSKKIAIWFPILGSDPRPVGAILDRERFEYIYPIVGFPSTRPMETDEIVRRNRRLVEGNPDNLIFASMNDPFQLAMRLNSTIDEMRRAFGEEVSIIISPHGSKPQSVGAFLAAMTKGAALLYCQPRSYKARLGGSGTSLLYWLKGDPYRR